MAADSGAGLAHGRRPAAPTGPLASPFERYCCHRQLGEKASATGLQDTPSEPTRCTSEGGYGVKERASRESASALPKRRGRCLEIPRRHRLWHISSSTSRLTGATEPI